MTRITIDAATVAKLKDAREMVELRDEAGKIVGHFLPGPPRDANGNIIIPLTDEELAEASRQEGGRPLKEIVDGWPKL